MAFEYSATVAFFISTATPEQLLELIRAIRLGEIADVEDCGLYASSPDEHKYKFTIILAKRPPPAEWQTTWAEVFKAFSAQKGIQFREVRWYINQPRG